MNGQAMRCLLAAVLCMLTCGAVQAGPRLSLDPVRFAAAPDHYIVAGIDNVRVAVVSHAGSSPRGYDSLSTYGPSPQARRILKELGRDYHLRQIRAWAIEPLHMYCAVLEIPEGADRDALLARLARDPRVRLAQPLQMFQTRTQPYNDPYVGLQRGFQQMDVADAHAIATGDGVRVAVIDTGADLHHPDLKERIQKAINVVDTDDRQFSMDRHGTEVAGVIAAAANNREGIVGVAPRAKLLIIKACWQLEANADPAECNSFTLAQGLVAALDAGAQVVNLSLAGPADLLLHQIIGAGLKRGVIFVGAAPEMAESDALMNQPGIIEVASQESVPQGDARVYAPGTEVLTLLPGGRYDFASGSSLATAQVTGLVALMLSRRPSLSSALAQRFLQQTSERLVHVGSNGSSPSVNACAALAAATGGGGCKPFNPRL